MVAYVPRMLLIGALTVSALGGSAAAFFLGARGVPTLDRVVTDTHRSVPASAAVAQANVRTAQP
jgi:hypothetical protein